MAIPPNDHIRALQNSQLQDIDCRATAKRLWRNLMENEILAKLGQAVKDYDAPGAAALAGQALDPINT